MQSNSSSSPTTELLKGGSLQIFLFKCGRKPPDESVKIGRNQAALHGHEHGALWLVVAVHINVSLVTVCSHAAVKKASALLGSQSPAVKSLTTSAVLLVLVHRQSVEKSLDVVLSPGVGCIRLKANSNLVLRYQVKIRRVLAQSHSIRPAWRCISAKFPVMGSLSCKIAFRPVPCDGISFM